MVRQWFFIASFFTVVALAVTSYYEPRALWSLIVIFSVISRGLFDSFQKEHAILRNFPIIGHGRYLLESIRPEIQQYFIEMDTEGKPMSREERSVVYQRAKSELDTIPFGTQHDVYKPGFEWVNHSLNATAAPKEAPRVLIGGPDCKKPYSASLLNISAMSFGALSPTAVQALNEGALKGGFAHNTRTTQLFINFGNNANLDGMGFSPFGKVVSGMDVVDSLYKGYGEGAPRGRGPDQGRIQSQGNSYLKEMFPELDYVKTATIVE